MAQLTQEQWEQIDLFLARNQKIQAIKLWRSLTGGGLAEGLAAVEARAAGRTEAGAGVAAQDGGAGDGVDWGPIDERLMSGDLIGAIKLYRAQTNVGLKEAKDAAEARRAQLGQHSPMLVAGQPTGCVGALVKVLLVALAGLLIVWGVMWLKK